MKTYTPVYFIKKVLICLLILIPVSIFIMNLTSVRAEDNNTKETGADELNKARKQLKNKMPKKVNWATLAEFETQDYTNASQEFACTSEKGCEIVDISPQVTP